MPIGTRYTDWAHIHLVGDIEVASRYIPEARKYLGEVMGGAEAAQLGVSKLRRELADGTVIVVEKIGQQPRITITPAPFAEESTPPTPNNFVVWARDAGLPDGIDADHPQQILRPSWTTYFFNGSVHGYEAFSGDKGIYQNQFPVGIRHAGNVDWIGQDKQRVSWYGPSSRYFFEPFVRAKVQYGQKVFMLGQVVIDLAVHQDTTPSACTWVLGAAIKGTHLYVVVANLPDEVTSTGTVNENVTVCDWPYASGEVQTEIHRYAIAPPPDFEIGRVALGNSRQILWAGSIAHGCAPWFFDPAVTTAHSFGLPSTFLAVSDTTTINPPATSPIHRLTNRETAWEYSSSSVSAPAGGMGAAAGDYDTDGGAIELRVERDVLDVIPAYSAQPGNLLHEQITLAIGDLRVPLRAFDWKAPGYFWMRRALLFSDIREGVMAFFRDEETAIPEETGTVTTSRYFEIWAAGSLAHEELVAHDSTGFTAINSTGLRREFIGNANYDWNSPFRSVAVAPAFYFYNLTTFNPSFRSGFYGFLSSYSMLPRQEASYFGSYHFPVSTSPTPGSPRTLVSEKSDVTAQHARLDFDGKDIVIGCAASDGVVLYSGHGGIQYGLESLAYVTGSDLGDLTGVAGENARFHPIWQLGKLLVVA